MSSHLGPAPRPALGGVGLGLLAALGLGGLLLGVSALASWVPGLRATAVDPMVALRSD